MKKLLASVALIAALTSPVLADDGFVVEGPGTMSCSQYNAIAQQNPVLDAGFMFWAQGFISAMNMARNANGAGAKNLSSIPVEQQQNLLRAYCKAHPTKDYGMGVMDLFGQFDDNTAESGNK